MPQNTPDPETLRAAANAISAALDALPPIEPREGQDRIEARETYNDALLALLDELKAHWTRPARIVTNCAGVAVSILGLRASSTSGHAGALRNWIAAARRRADELERANTGTPTVAGGEGAHG